MRGKLLGANDETPSRYYDNQNGVNHYNIMIVKIMMMMIMMMIMMIMIYIGAVCHKSHYFFHGGW